MLDKPLLLIMKFAGGDDEPSQKQLLDEHMACILTRECSIFLRNLFGISDTGKKFMRDSTIN